MKKIIIPILFGVLLCMSPMDLFAKNYCLTDGFSFYVLNGGTINEKPFAGRFISITNGGCHATLWASAVTVGPGTVALWIDINYGPPCVNFNATAITDTTLSGSGNFDNQDDAVSEGNLTFTPVSCSSVPRTLFASKKTKLPSQRTPGFEPKQ